MKSGGDPPPAPDPSVTAQAQGQSNIQTAIANARLNRVNQTTPWGSISYTQGPVDANGVPTYSSDIKLDPQQQSQLDEQRRQQTQRQQIAAALLGQAGGALSKPLDLSGAHQVYDRYASQQPPKPVQQAPQAQPSATSASRDAMLAQLMQYLQSAGQMPGGGNPTARYADALRGNGSSSPSTVAASGASTPTPATPATQAPAPGQSPYGTSGIDIMNTRAGRSSWDTEQRGAYPDAAVSRYANDPRVDAQGAITLNGQRYYQVGDPGNTADARTGRTIDHGRSIYDPEFGYLTPADNYHTPDESWLDRYMPAIVAAGFGGAAMAAAGGGAGAAAGEGAGTGAFDVGGSTGFGGTVPLESGAAATTAGSTIPMGDMGAAAGSGAPVTDLSVAATQPSMGTQMMTNLQNGRGLLGMSGGQRAAAGAIPALIQLLRNGGQRRGG